MSADEYYDPTYVFDEIDEFELTSILREDLRRDIEAGYWPRLGAEVMDSVPPSQDPSGLNFYDVILGDRVYRVSVRDIGAAIR